MAEDDDVKKLRGRLEVVAGVVDDDLDPGIRVGSLRMIHQPDVEDGPVYFNGDDRLGTAVQRCSDVVASSSSHDQHPTRRSVGSVGHDITVNLSRVAAAETSLREHDLVPDVVDEKYVAVDENELLVARPVLVIGAGVVRQKNQGDCKRDSENGARLRPVGEP